MPSSLVTIAYYCGANYWRSVDVHSDIVNVHDIRNPVFTLPHISNPKLDVFKPANLTAADVIVTFDDIDHDPPYVHTIQLAQQQQHALPITQTCPATRAVRVLDYRQLTYCPPIDTLPASLFEGMRKSRRLDPVPYLTFVADDSSESEPESPTMADLVETPHDPIQAALDNFMSQPPIASDLAPTDPRRAPVRAAAASAPASAPRHIPGIPNLDAVPAGPAPTEPRSSSGSERSEPSGTYGSEFRSLYGTAADSYYDKICNGRQMGHYATLLKATEPFMQMQAETRMYPCSSITESARLDKVVEILNNTIHSVHEVLFGRFYK